MTPRDQGDANEREQKFVIPVRHEQGQGHERQSADGNRRWRNATMAHRSPSDRGGGNDDRERQSHTVDVRRQKEMWATKTTLKAVEYLFMKFCLFVCLLLRSN